MDSDLALCVFCRRQPVDPEWRPFCSERCKLADLARWLNGDYRVPAGSAEVAAIPDDPGDEDAARK